MKSRAASTTRSLGGWLVVALFVIVLQFLTISNVNLNPGWSTDTLSYGQQFSPISLPRVLRLFLNFLSPVTLQPLGPIITHSYRTQGRGWAGGVWRAVWRFESPTANFASFTVVNSAFWLLVVFIAARLYRTLKPRRRPSREGEIGQAP